MHDSGFRRWVVMGVLASASWLVAACGALPQQPGNESFAPGGERTPAQTGYNGTIKDIPTSIDPRTPEKEGTTGRSLAMDNGERALLEQQGMGGSGPAAIYYPGRGPAYEGMGAHGSLYDPTRQRPAAESIPGQATERSGVNASERR